MFLENTQKSGSPLDHGTLVRRCLDDESVLQFICNTTQKAIARQTASKSLLSLYAVTLIQVLGKSQQPHPSKAVLVGHQTSEHLLNIILSSVFDALAPPSSSASISSSTEYQVFEPSLFCLVFNQSFIHSFIHSFIRSFIDRYIYI